MKMNKEQFLKTEFGGELESTITAWDDALSRNRAVSYTHLTLPTILRV